MDIKDKIWLIPSMFVYGFVIFIWTAKTPTLLIPNFSFVVKIYVLLLAIFFLFSIFRYTVFSISTNGYLNSITRAFSGIKKWTIILLIITIIHTIICSKIYDEKIGYSSLVKCDNLYNLVDTDGQVITKMTKMEFYKLEKYEHLKIVSQVCNFFAMGLMILNKKSTHK